MKASASFDVAAMPHCGQQHYMVTCIHHKSSLRVGVQWGVRKCCQASTLSCVGWPCSVQRAVCSMHVCGSSWWWSPICSKAPFIIENHKCDKDPSGEKFTNTDSLTQLTCTLCSGNAVLQWWTRPLWAIFINSTPLMSEKTKWRRKIWPSIAGVVGRCIMKYQSPIELALIIPASRYFFIFTTSVNVWACLWLCASLTHTWINTNTHTVRPSVFALLPYTLTHSVMLC